MVRLGIYIPSKIPIQETLLFSKEMEGLIYIAKYPFFPFVTAAGWGFLSFQQLQGKANITVADGYAIMVKVISDLKAQRLYRDRTFSCAKVESSTVPCII